MNKPLNEGKLMVIRVGPFGVLTSLFARWLGPIP